MQGLIYQKQDMLQASQQFQHGLQLKKFSAFKGKKFQLFVHKHRVVSSVAGLNSSMLQRLLSHKEISPADWELAGTSSILPQNSALSKAAVAHELQALYSTVGIHLHQHSHSDRHSQVRTQQCEWRELYKNVRIKL